jgi:hypothetical protein
LRNPAGGSGCRVTESWRHRWATDNPQGGTVFHFTLSCVSQNDTTVSDESRDQIDMSPVDLLGLPSRPAVSAAGCEDLKLGVRA